MKNPRLVLDLDGVFADFAGGACVVHNRPDFVVDKWNFFTDWNITSEEFWGPIRDRGDCFYEHIVQPYPWARELLNACKYLDPACVFASVAGGGHNKDYSGKLLFVRKYFGDTPLIVLPGSCKQMLAAPGRVLLDDSDDNIVLWRASKGIGITFPQPWNEAHDDTTHRLVHMRYELGRALK